MARIGIMIEAQEGLNWDRWRRICHDVDTLGLDSLWRSDHFHTVLGGGEHEPRDCIETWVSLALAAEWTSRIEFGPLVSPMTFRPPALLARMAASVDVLSGGRLVLGVGAGWYEDEHRLYEIPFPDLKQRMDNFEHGIQLIRRVLDTALPKPARQPMPILIGGSGERRTLHLVAQYADEWNFNVLPPDEAARRIEILERHCREVGRDPKTIRKSMMTSYLTGRDRSELLERARQMSALMPRLAGLDPEQALAQLAERWPVGTPDEVAAWFKPYVALGIDRFMLQHFLMDDSDALQLLATEVAPRLP